jgi:hypothetical protein
MTTVPPIFNWTASRGPVLSTGSMVTPSPIPVASVAARAPRLSPEVMQPTIALIAPAVFIASSVSSSVTELLSAFETVIFRFF